MGGKILNLEQKLLDMEHKVYTENYPGDKSLFWVFLIDGQEIKDSDIKSDNRPGIRNPGRKIVYGIPRELLNNVPLVHSDFLLERVPKIIQIVESQQQYLDVKAAREAKLEAKEETRQATFNKGFLERQQTQEKQQEEMKELGRQHDLYFSTKYPNLYPNYKPGTGGRRRRKTKRNRKRRRNTTSKRRI